MSWQLSRCWVTWKGKWTEVDALYSIEWKRQKRLEICRWDSCLRACEIRLLPTNLHHLNHLELLEWQNPAQSRLILIQGRVDKHFHQHSKVRGIDLDGLLLLYVQCDEQTDRSIKVDQTVRSSLPREYRCLLQPNLLSEELHCRLFLCQVSSFWTRCIS